MIKGVNKQVLEITETENGFFEKAIFFVKPEYTGMSEGRLKETAKNEMKGITKPPSNKFFGKKKTTGWLFYGAIFILGVITGLVFSTI
jgi:hypothetical protein